MHNRSGPWLVKLLFQRQEFIAPECELFSIALLRHNTLTLQQFEIQGDWASGSCPFGVKPLLSVLVVSREEKSQSPQGFFCEANWEESAVNSQ